MGWLDFIVMEQVSLWDGIIPSKEHAKFLIHTTNKYRFIDQVSLWYLALSMYRPELAGLRNKHSLTPCIHIRYVFHNFLVTVLLIWW